MLGTFGGALEARKIDASDGRLSADVRGEIETEDGVLVIRRIHVRMRLKTGDGNRETATRVHGIFADRCPVYRSLKPAIAMTTELISEPLDE